VDGGKGCVEPSLASVLDGTYVPLARPLYVYVNTDKVKTNKTIYPFLEFYAAQLDALAQKAKFLPLTAAQKKVLDDDLAEMKKDAGL
jgi:phosphate transport system substrate-binding protein